MGKQQKILAFFLTLSYVDLKLNEILAIIRKLNGAKLDISRLMP